jgi:hypothetical protein
MNFDHRVDRLLLPNPLNDISGLQIHRDGISGAGDLVRKSLDFGEGCYESIPLRRILFAAFSDGDRIFEYGIVFPQRKFLDRGTARKQLN